MTDREEQAFRAVYATVLAEAPETPGWDQVDAPQVRLQAESAERRRRPLLVALAATAIALLGVGVPAFFVFGGGGDGAGSDRLLTATAPVATTGLPETVPTVSAVPLPDLGGPGLRWHPAAAPPAMGMLEQLWATPAGVFYAYGDGRIWASPDGETWDVFGDVPGSPNLDATPSSPALVSFGEGFIALDLPSPGAERVGTPPRLLVSADGRDWTVVELPVEVRSPHPDLLFTVGLEAVAAGPGGVVVVGRAHPSVDPAAIERAFPDLGTVWDTDRVAPCCAGGSPYTTDLEDPLWVWTVESEEPQAVSLAVLGLTTDDLWNRPTVLWRSEDGRSFFAVELEFEILEVTMLGTPDGIVLVSEGTSEVWTSSDGRNWSVEVLAQELGFDWAVWGSRIIALAEHDGETVLLELRPDGSWRSVAESGTFLLPEPAGVVPEAVAAGDLGLLVVGSAEQVLPESEGEPIPFAQVVWYSSDGAEWSVQGLGEIFGAAGSLQTAVIADRVVVAFGANQPHAGRRPTIEDPAWWIGTLRD